MSLFGSLERVRNKFLRDAATLQVAGAVNQTSQVLSTVLIAYLLGSQGQGIYISAIALQALVYFLVNVGVAQATVSQIAASGARDNTEKIAGWIAFMAKAVLVFGFFILLFGYFVMPKIGEWIFGFFDEVAVAEGRRIGFWAWILCLQPLLELPRIVAGVAFQGTRRMYALGQIENGQELVRLFLVVLGATITGRPEGAFVGHLVACGVSSLVAVDIYRRTRRTRRPDETPLPGVREVVQRMRDVPLRRGLRLGLRVGILKNGHTLFLTIFPRLIIGGVVGLSWVAYFHIAQRIMQVPTMFMLGVSRTALPALGELAGLKDMASFRRLFVRMSFITGSLITLGIVGLMPIVEPLAGKLFPEDYAVPVGTFYAILALGYIPLSFAVALEAFYITTNHVRQWLWITVIGALITIPTNVWLVFKIPYTGTAWGHSLYQSWTLVHLAYVAYFFATTHRRTTWGGDDEELPAAPAAATAAESAH